MFPDFEDFDYLSELQFALAYSQLIVPMSTNDMVPVELRWWYDRLVKQRDLERKHAETSKGSGKGQSLQSLADKFGNQPLFGEMKSAR